MLGTSNMENYIIVTDDSDRNYSIPAERKAEFETWHEELFGEFLGRDDDWIEYLIASDYNEAEGPEPDPSRVVDVTHARQLFSSFLTLRRSPRGLID